MFQTLVLYRSKGPIVHQYCTPIVRLMYTNICLLTVFIITCQVFVVLVISKLKHLQEGKKTKHSPEILLLSPLLAISWKPFH